jgi:hypothetical protein
MTNSLICILCVQSYSLFPLQEIIQRLFCSAAVKIVIFSYRASIPFWTAPPEAIVIDKHGLCLGKL